MDYKLFITRSAENDLDQIVAYLVNDLANPAAASALLDEIEAVYSRLAVLPYACAACLHPLLSAPGYRKAVIRGYLLLYRVDDARKIVYIERFFSDLEDYAHKI